ncbi:MAG: hypothetical protein Q4F54_05035 [Coriobacteriia bacterium]|nr:hypothetical protein [Coriobacteriia bacterium]
MGCLELQEVKLPDQPAEGEEHPIKFAEHTTTTNSMFAACKSLLNVNLNGNFGSAVTDACAMFYDCRALKTITFNSPLFGSHTSNFYDFCNNCYSLKSINIHDTSIGTKNPGDDESISYE